MKSILTVQPAKPASFLADGVHWENWSKKCASHLCQTSRLRAIFNGKGILVFDDWYCGPDCMEYDLQWQFAEFSKSNKPVEPPRPARVPLGLMLFSRGFLNDEQFKVALEEHRQSGMRVGDIALQLGFVNEEQVATALAGQWGYPVFSFKNATLELPLLVPLHLMELHQMLPIRFTDDTQKLLVGFATRVEHSVIQGIEKMLHCKVSPCFVTASDFHSRIQAFTSNPRQSQYIFDQASDNVEIAQIVRTYVSQNSATEVRFAACREYLWTRISGPGQQLDLLFKLEITQP